MERLKRTGFLEGVGSVQAAAASKSKQFRSTGLSPQQLQRGANCKENHQSVLLSNIQLVVGASRTPRC